MAITTKLVGNILVVTLNEQKANQMSNDFFLSIKSIFENVKLIALSYRDEQELERTPTKLAN